MRKRTALQGEYQDLEVRHRAAIVAEGEAAADQAGRFAQTDDAEAAEIRSLRARVSIQNYLGSAAGNYRAPGRRPRIERGS